jgi:predicted phosphoadenosine phosphosulfate sulfurtransferase
MEFEEFDVLFGDWYSHGETTAVLVGIRADESLNRFRTVASRNKETFGGLRWTTKITEKVYNAYPIYDWRTEDIWTYHARYPDRARNGLYDLMHRAGVPLAHQRICQPYGDDQRRGLWLYHLIEPRSWFKVVARVNGANSGALYVTEIGNVAGYGRVTKPANHTWQSFCKLLLASLPAATRRHFEDRFGVFVRGWYGRGYRGRGIPDEAPRVLEKKHWAPSWRRMCHVLLRNDWWCKGLGLQQPKSEAYGRYLEMREARRSEDGAARAEK